MTLSLMNWTKSKSKFAASGSIVASRDLIDYKRETSLADMWQCTDMHGNYAGSRGQRQQGLSSSRPNGLTAQDLDRVSSFLPIQNCS